MDEPTDYLKGRLDERRALMGWLRAAAADEPLPSYANAFRLAAEALAHLNPAAEFDGLNIRPMAVGVARDD